MIMNRCISSVFILLLFFLLGACSPVEPPVTTPNEPTTPNDSTLVELDKHFVVSVDNLNGGNVTLIYQGDTVQAPLTVERNQWLTILMIPDDQHILTGSNVVKGCAARDSFQVKMDTVIRPAFESIVPETPAEHHKICNYNIRYYNGSSDNANTGNRSWTLRKEKVFEMIRKHKMDVCGIEEITAQQAPDFLASLTEYEYIGYGRDNGKEYSAGGTGEQTGILYRKARYVKQDQGRFFLSTTPHRASKSFGSSFNRMVTWVKLKERNSDKTFYFFATHFDHPITQAGINTRSSQADVALATIPEIVGEYPMFFVGDFNCEPTEPAYDKLQQRWTDAFVAMGEQAQGGYICNEEQETLFPDACAEGGNTYTGLYSSSDKEPKRIDFVFFDSKKTNIISYLADNDNLGLEAYPSDHLPVITEMIW